MSQGTSVSAYHSIRDSGLLGELQLKVVHAIALNGPLTSGELAEYHLDAARVSISPRLAELKTQGVVKEAEKRACAATGRECIAWDLTGNVPAKLSKKELILKEIQKFEGKIEKLKKKLLELA